MATDRMESSDATGRSGKFAVGLNILPGKLIYKRRYKIYKILFREKDNQNETYRKIT